MAHALVREPKLVFDGTVGSEDENVLVGQVASQTAFQQRLGLGFQHERSSRHDVLLESLGIQGECVHLAADDALVAVVQVVENLQRLRLVGERRQGDQFAVTIDHADNVGHHIRGADSVLLHQAGFLKLLPKQQSAGITGRQFVAHQFDFQIVDPSACASAEAMLDGLDGNRTVAQRRAPGALADIVNQGGYTNGRRLIRADEGDPGMSFGGPEAQRGRLARKQASALELNGSRDGLLMLQAVPPVGLVS